MRGARLIAATQADWAAVTNRSSAASARPSWLRPCCGLKAEVLERDADVFPAPQLAIEDPSA